MKRENLIEKIRALMSKTVDRGCTEAEMVAALAKARAMIDAYEVSEAELKLAKEEAAILRKEPPGTKDPHRIKSALGMAIGAFTDTECWRGAGGGICFLGQRSDVQFATWLMDSLTNFVQAELAKYLIEDARIYFGNQRKQAMEAFCAGCCSRISKRMKELVAQSKTQMTGSGKELMVIKNQLITTALDKLGIKLSSSRSTRRKYDLDAYRAGQAAGDRASFGRPVTGGNATLRLN